MTAVCILHIASAMPGTFKAKEKAPNLGALTSGVKVSFVIPGGLRLVCTFAQCEGDLALNVSVIFFVETLHVLRPAAAPTAKNRNNLDLNRRLDHGRGVGLVAGIHVIRPSKSLFESRNTGRESGSASHRAGERGETEHGTATTLHSWMGNLSFSILSIVV